jgi:hypothetical protein
MLENERGESGHVFRPDGIAFACELIQSSIDVERAPQNNECSRYTRERGNF